MKAYPPDLRTKIVTAVEAGRSQTEMARVFGVGLSTVKRYLKQHQETGSLAPKRHPGRAPPSVLTNAISFAPNSTPTPPPSSMSTVGAGRSRPGTG